MQACRSDSELLSLSPPSSSSAERVVVVQELLLPVERSARQLVLLPLCEYNQSASLAVLAQQHVFSQLFSPSNILTRFWLIIEGTLRAKSHQKMASLIPLSVCVFVLCFDWAGPNPRPGLGQDERLWLLAGQSPPEGGQPGGRSLLWPPAPKVS